jgi:hypothetical protein
MPSPRRHNSCSTQFERSVRGVVSSDGGLTRWLATLGVVRSPHREVLDAMIAAATVDRYDSECVMGFSAMFGERLAMLFQACVLGVDVIVTGVDVVGDDQIVAVCARGRWRQRIGDPGFAVAGS